MEFKSVRSILLLCPLCLEFFLFKNLKITTTVRNTLILQTSAYIHRHIYNWNRFPKFTPLLLVCILVSSDLGCFIFYKSWSQSHELHSLLHCDLQCGKQQPTDHPHSLPWSAKPLIICPSPSFIFKDFATYTLLGSSTRSSLLPFPMWFRELLLIL